MKTTNSLDRKFETTAWGLLLIWWGLRWWPLESLPNGVGLLGTGMILLGLNAARSLNGIAARGVTTALGILALVFGGFLLANDVMELSLQLPIFEILLIGFGAFLLIRAFRKPETKIGCCS